MVELPPQPDGAASLNGVICIAGPTASGKSAAAMAIAQRCPAEIVSVDSAQVYRGMDVGTAKPDAAERAAVPHHLIDLIDPLQSYSAAQFAADARAAIGQIRARGRVPLLVGGTMLYFKALLYGLDELPAADQAIRDRIDLEALSFGWPALHERLREVDPATAARLAPGDSQRIQRALEVWESTGRPLSSFHTSADPAQAGLRGALPEGLRFISMEPADRSWLHHRIDARLDTMLAAGLLDEVRALHSRRDLDTGLPSMRCVGYRQYFEALDQYGEPLPANAMARATAAAKAASRQLAKRQLTWLRSMTHRSVVPCDAPDAIEQVVAMALGPRE